MPSGLSGHLLHHYFPSISISKPSSTNGGKATAPTFSSCKILQNYNNNNLANSKSVFGSNNIISIAIVLALATPLPTLAIPSFNSQPFSLPSTPFSQAKNLPTGLDNGKIRTCPSINPGCVSTNPKSSSFAFPWSIPENSSDNAIQKLQDAILKTQKNVKIQLVEDTPNGQYLQAEVGGGFGRDVLEFLVNGDVVAYRAMATKVTYIYPFTTAFGDSKGQEERMMKIVNELGWYAPSFDSMD